jgi:choline dehydrogenase-like flavoprotein
MKYEVVVIGSGAGGGTVAYNLAKAGINTLMLESGCAWLITCAWRIDTQAAAGS